MWTFAMAASSFTSRAQRARERESKSEQRERERERERRSERPKLEEAHIRLATISAQCLYLVESCGIVRLLQLEEVPSQQAAPLVRLLSPVERPH